MIGKRSNELGIGRAYCYRLLRRLRADPSITAVRPRARGRSTGSRILDTKVEATIFTAVKQFYLGPKQPPVAVLVREIAQRCAEQGLKAPTYKAVAVRVHAFGQSEAPQFHEEAAVMHPSRGVVGFLNDPDLGSSHDDVLAKEIVQRQEFDELCRHVWEHSGVAQDVPIRLLRSAGVPHQLELEHQARWDAAAALVICDSAQRFAAERRESRTFYQRVSADTRSLRHRLSSQSTDPECPYYAINILLRLETWSTQRTAEAPSTNRIRGQAARALAVDAMRLFIAAFRTTPTVYIGGPARLFLSEAFNLVERQAKRKDIMVRVPSASSVLSLIRQAVSEAQTGPVPHWQHLLGMGPQ